METSKVSSHKPLEKIKDQSLVSVMGKKFLISFLGKIQIGTLHVTTSEGESYQFGNNSTPHATIEIKDPRFYNHCIKYGDIGFGEAFMHKYWDTNSVYDVIKIFILNMEELSLMSGSNNKVVANLLNILNRTQHVLRKNTQKKAVENIAEHYDLSNDFFKLWLDETMTYSCGLWESKTSTLKEAQIAKWNRLIDKLQITAEDSVLEIGTGWGGFSLHLAKTVGCKITTTTISQQQYDYAKNLFSKNKVEHLITLVQKDYRDLNGQFDKVVSFEMMEAIGHEFMPVFIKKVSALMKPQGLFGCQVITCPDSRYPEFRKGVDWIQKHIFPGSLLISVSHLLHLAAKGTQLQAYDLFDMGMHYEKTLLTWKKSFAAKQDELKNLGLKEVFIRKWFYYFDYCAAAFATRNISVVQLCMTNPNNIKLKTEL